MESIAGFKAHAPLPVFRGIRFTVLRRISRLFLGLAFVCVSSPLCAVPSMSVAVDDKLCEAWIVECRGGYSVAFSDIEHESWIEVLQSGDVTLDMFVTDGGSVLKEDAREMWAIILGEWEKVILTNGGNELKPIRSAKILAWCIAPTSVTRDGAGGLATLVAAALSDE